MIGEPALGSSGRAAPPVEKPPCLHPRSARNSELKAAVAGAVERPQPRRRHHLVTRVFERSHKQPGDETIARSSGVIRRLERCVERDPHDTCSRCTRTFSRFGTVSPPDGSAGRAAADPPARTERAVLTRPARRVREPARGPVSGPDSMRSPVAPQSSRCRPRTRIASSPPAARVRQTPRAVRDRPSRVRAHRPSRRYRAASRAVR